MYTIFSVVKEDSGPDIECWDVVELVKSHIHTANMVITQAIRNMMTVDRLI